ncbi:uncharacterized protein LOC127263680 [Andrographis paniculata]|uniref:uncharacterized protein LOC127263680 n=1 Tax=Andrographis paniculata TaxID=175694 RepID=UPI0021E837FC|nr:uncharacterized protein LOC127263680 [Andrographis paniculata]XP_051148785.1 uncharacterized protein LOC127263680 [Andrographis paniculata]XP_051148786.1 uncharacterized protein LOC127263680 [Andrographis paniculata]XP_051148787.1 uncharacterized protein LOC127263680 [Andrographis paniculata]XP_051148788.1 uncharacterized protein LOC127263680 [Andrographis paniculata]
MDSASSSLPSNSRDGSTSAVAVEDDAALSVAAGMAKEAALLFQAGKYAECRRILNQLLQKKDDPKVRHNIVITENFKDGGSDSKKLLESLESIKKQSEELAQTSGEHLEVSSNDGGKPMSEMKGINNEVDRYSRSSVVFSDEFDTSVAVFNIAVIWFHLHEYSKSFSYLDTLYQIIEPIDEGTALRICLLLLDVSLLSHHASRSVDVISYMEKVFCINSLTNQVDNGTSAQHQSLLVPKHPSLPGNSTSPDPSQSDTAITSNALENSLTRTLSEEALEDESFQLLSSLDISGQKLQRPVIPSSGDPTRNQAEESLSVDDLRLKMHLFKVRLFLLTRNLKAAKREVKMAMNLARGKEYPMALYLKSQLEYVRRNYRKAIKLLMASSNLKEPGISSMYYNNLGCIYYQLGKYHISGVFFSKALKNCSLVRKEKPSKLQTLVQDKSLLISYNCGMYSLACGRPLHAARCFQKASLLFSDRPLLWLRIAECCLMALEKGLILSISPGSEKCDIGVNVIGEGKWRELALRHGVSSNGQWEDVEVDHLFVDDSKKLELSMPLARQCLVNALYLLDYPKAKDSRSGSPLTTEESNSGETTLSESTDPKTMTVGDHEEPNVASGSIQPNSNGEVKEQKGGNTLNAPLQNSVIDYEQIQMKENQMIKQFVLADLAYVELSLGNPLKALSTAKSLLKLPDCSRVYTFLGIMYVAEALCLLNQPLEAAEHLMMYVSRGDVELPYNQEDCENWKTEKGTDNEDLPTGRVAPGSMSSSDKSQTAAVCPSPEEARGIFCANYAANLALLGDLEQAHHFVTKALSEVPRSPQAILTAIYLDLKRGKTQAAVAKLRQHSAARFLPGNVTLSASS